MLRHQKKSGGALLFYGFTAHSLLLELGSQRPLIPLTERALMAQWLHQLRCDFKAAKTPVFWRLGGALRKAYNSF